MQSQFPRKPLRRLARALPAAWYREPRHYQRELERIWYRHWVAVARAEEVASPGAWRRVELGEQPLLLVRGEHGVLRAFYNVCRHRGSALCSDDEGTFERGRIVCPYHAWTYDLEGRLVATPRRMPTPDFDPRRFALHEAACASWGGFVFVNLAGRRARPLLRSLGAAPERFARYRFDRLRIGKRIVAEVRANWKLLCENFSECYHCPPVHPELVRVVRAYREAGAWGLRGPETSPEYAPGARTLTLDGSTRIPPFAALTEAERETLYVPWLVPPGLFLNVHPDYVNSHMMLPAGPARVRIVYDWLFEPEHLPRGADLEHYTKLWEITNAQDARNCEWQQQGLAARPFRHGWYVPQEFDCLRFARWVRAALGASTRARTRRATRRRARRAPAR
ncbi:MAG: aromatic ring-hydroxylating dioxygenase subunit alpha [Burkholderiales bacterium]|nr:aromatic ring-hydroxylating dioxygenase subunit alpha [Burkholderiales bacterium]